MQPKFGAYYSDEYQRATQLEQLTDNRFHAKAWAYLGTFCGGVLEQKPDAEFTFTSLERANAAVDSWLSGGSVDDWRRYAWKAA